MGNILPPEHFKELYGVDNVMYSDEIKKFCEDYKPDTIFTTYGQNFDSELWCEEGMSSPLASIPSHLRGN